MPAKLSFLRAAAGLLCVVGMLSVSAATAADNSGVVIIDQQHSATPFGRYDSQRRTQVFGPASGFRYEEYQTPIQPVHPRYRNYYGNGHRGHRRGRVIERRPGVNGNGRHQRRAAPRIEAYARHGRGFGRRHGHGRHHTDDRSTHRRSTGRAITPSRRAIEPSARVIDTR